MEDFNNKETVRKQWDVLFETKSLKKKISPLHLVPRPLTCLCSIQKIIIVSEYYIVQFLVHFVERVCSVYANFTKKTPKKPTKKTKQNKTRCPKNSLTALVHTETEEGSEKRR